MHGLVRGPYSPHKMRCPHKMRSPHKTPKNTRYKNSRYRMPRRSP